MTGQFDLGSKHQECIKKTKELIEKIDQKVPVDENPKEIIKKYLAESFGTLPGDNEIYNDYLGMTISLEEVSKTDSLSAYIMADQIIFREILKKYSGKKYEDYLNKGETVSLLCMEPGYTGLQDLQTSASKTQGSWQLQGTKIVSNEQLYCDKYVVFTRDEENKIRLFLISENEITLEEKEKIISSANIVFNQVKIDLSVSEDRNIAEINDDFEKVMTIARMIIAAISTGIGHSALVKSIETAKEAKNAKEESLSSSQNVQFELADMFTEIESARMLTYLSADTHDKGKNAIKVASMAKVKASEASNKVIMQSFQIFGNIGFIANTDFAPLVQRSIDSTVKGGTNRLQRSQIYDYMLAKK